MYSLLWQQVHIFFEENAGTVRVETGHLGVAGRHMVTCQRAPCSAWQYMHGLSYEGQEYAVEEVLWQGNKRPHRASSACGECLHTARGRSTWSLPCKDDLLKAEFDSKITVLCMKWNGNYRAFRHMADGVSAAHDHSRCGSLEHKPQAC